MVKGSIRSICKIQLLLAALWHFSNYEPDRMKMACKPQNTTHKTAVSTYLATELCVQGGRQAQTPWFIVQAGRWVVPAVIIPTVGGTSCHSLGLLAPTS